MVNELTQIYLSEVFLSHQNFTTQSPGSPKLPDRDTGTLASAATEAGFYTVSGTIVLRTLLKTETGDKAVVRLALAFG